MNSAGHDAAVPHESDFTVMDHFYLKTASRWEYKSEAQEAVLWQIQE